jgi:transcriptional regulator with XRE-family HTH domain
MNNSFGHLIRISRLQARLTVQDLIKRIDLDLSASYFTRIELHGEIPNAKVIIKLAKALDLPKQKLLNLAKKIKLERYKNLLDRLYKE